MALHPLCDFTGVLSTLVFFYSTLFSIISHDMLIVNFFAAEQILEKRDRELYPVSRLSLSIMKICAVSCCFNDACADNKITEVLAFLAFFRITGKKNAQLA